MKYLVLYKSRDYVNGATTDLRGKVAVQMQTIHTLEVEEFEDKRNAVQFCKQNNGVIVKSVDLVLEPDE